MSDIRYFVSAAFLGVLIGITLTVGAYTFFDSTPVLELNSCYKHKFRSPETYARIDSVRTELEGAPVIYKWSDGYENEPDARYTNEFLAIYELQKNCFGYANSVIDHNLRKLEKILKELE